MKEKVSFMVNLLGCGLIGACLFFAAGCETPGGGAEEPQGDTKPAVPKGVAVVDQVDKEFNYVILKTSAKIPGEMVLDVYRGDEVVGKVKLDGTRSGDFVSADIVEGDIKKGDTIRLK